MTNHLANHIIYNGPCEHCESYCVDCNACACVIHADELLVMELSGISDSWREYE